MATAPEISREYARKYGSDPWARTLPRLPRRQPRGWLDLTDLGTPIDAVSIRVRRIVTEATRPEDGWRIFTAQAALDCGDCGQEVLHDLAEIGEEDAFNAWLIDLAGHAQLNGCGLSRLPETIDPLTKG